MTAADSHTAAFEQIRRRCITALHGCAALGIFTEVYDRSLRCDTVSSTAPVIGGTAGSLKRTVNIRAGSWQVWYGFEAGLDGGPRTCAIRHQVSDYLAAHAKSLQSFGEALKVHSAVTNKGVLERHGFAAFTVSLRRRRHLGHLMSQVLEHSGELWRPSGVQSSRKT